MFSGRKEPIAGRRCGTRAVPVLCLVLVCACSVAITASCGVERPGPAADSGTLRLGITEDALSVGELERCLHALNEISLSSTYQQQRVTEHVRRLSQSIGVRVVGTSGEESAFSYIDECLRSYGYETREQVFALPGGSTSRNLCATSTGRVCPETLIVVGAHYDSRGPGPGANDNGTGVGVLLELARALSRVPAAPSVEMVFFGAEEVIPGGSPEDHHFGSMHYVAELEGSEGESIAGMICADMVGYGPDLHVRNLGLADQWLRTALEEYFNSCGFGCTYLRDPGLSDHESFERAGIPAVWLEWRDDPLIHTAADTFDHVDFGKVEVVGSTLLGFLRSFTAESVGRQP